MGPISAEGPTDAGDPLRAFLQRPEHPHALVLTGVRTSAQAVARDLWARAAERDHLFLTLGRRLLPLSRTDDGPPAHSLVHLPDPLPGDISWERRILEVRQQAHLRGLRGLSLLVAPGQHVPNGLPALDAVLDAAGLNGGTERFCLYPVAWLRRQGPVEAVDLVRTHGDTLVLP